MRSGGTLGQRGNRWIDAEMISDLDPVSSPYSRLYCQSPYVFKKRNVPRSDGGGRLAAKRKTSFFSSVLALEARSRISAGADRPYRPGCTFLHSEKLHNCRSKP